MVVLPKKVAQQVLEALEAETSDSWECNSYHPKIHSAIATLRQALEAEQQAGPNWMVLVPKRMTTAMRRVTDEEGWTWGDLLAAAEAITEAEYADLGRSQQQVEPAEHQRFRRGMQILNWNRSQDTPPIVVTKELWVAQELEQFYTAPQPAQQPSIHQSGGIPAGYKLVPVASIYITPSGEREFDDWRVDLPAGRNLLYTHPQPAQQPAIPEGWKLVPVEPTLEMLDAGLKRKSQARWMDGASPLRARTDNLRPANEIAALQWEAMLSAAPEAPVRQPLTVDQLMDVTASAGIPFVAGIGHYVKVKEAIERAHNIK